MSDEPIKGFGQRITKRARLPASVIIAYPFSIVVWKYLHFLIQNGYSFLDAFIQVKQDIGLIAFIYPALPVVVFSFFRELEVHILLDKLIGVRKKVGIRIVELMKTLAKQNGYKNPERIQHDAKKARDWFYQYVNKQDVLRRYAFEVWEGYYVSLYISAASVIAIIICLLFLILVSWQTVLSFIFFPTFLLAAFWARLKWGTIQKIMDIPVQQVSEFPTASILDEANSRFG